MSWVCWMTKNRNLKEMAAVSKRWNSKAESTVTTALGHKHATHRALLVELVIVSV
jgi:hypothetical protein